MNVKSYAECTVQAGFAVIRLSNPPVNALSQALIEELLRVVVDSEKKEEIKGCILMGASDKFSGGADIAAFSEAQKPGAKNLRDLLDAIEKSTKTFIAAIDGIALGGGLELALTCDYRCSSKNAMVGLPEIKLGLLPGAGGTQRLPRLVGVELALATICGGEPIAAQKAVEMGIIDEIIEGDLLEGALDFASRSIKKSPKRKVSAMSVKSNADTIEMARKTAPSAVAGGLAQHCAIDCIEASATKDFASGLTFEGERFMELLQSEQAKGRIHIFFAERNVSKVPNLSPTAKPVPVKKAAVIGAGTMGGGIAINFLNADIPVVLIDTTDELVARGRKHIEKVFAGSVEKGKLSQAACAKKLQSLSTATVYDGLKDVDMVIEAVFEDLKVKKSVFEKLSEICSPTTILATNTSTLNIDEIASVAKNSERVIGMHFFSPANVMKLLEIVRGKATSDDTIATAMQIGKAMKKVGVLVGNCDGFVGNRMIAGYIREAELLLEEGALPEQIDKVMSAFGFAMGPFAVGDLAGNDIGYRIRKEREARGPLPHRLSELGNIIVEKGRHGQKTGAGWYKYEPGNRKPQPDKEVEDMILAESKRLGIIRREISADEIVKRIVYPLINEGAKILEEGIAIRSSDIDVIWIYGYGFPAFRGGPMHYADTIGLGTVCNDLLQLEKEHGDFWKPAPLLEKLARENKKFADFKGA
jgi:3-hydroxyacyl-CoA dehydrogenase